MSGPPVTDFMSHEWFGPASVVIMFLQVEIIALMAWLIFSRKQKSHYDYYAENYGRARY
jgi:hypothetical protein